LLRVHHINLVSLVGYCDERDHLALIYEYMSNKDLKHHLSGERLYNSYIHIFLLTEKSEYVILQSTVGKHGGSVLKWNTRLQIAVDAALGLNYPKIITFMCFYYHKIFYVGLVGTND